jgi:hypothetical protein
MKPYRTLCLVIAFALTLLGSSLTNLESLENRQGRLVPNTSFVSPVLRSTRGKIYTM